MDEQVNFTLLDPADDQAGEVDDFTPALEGHEDVDEGPEGMDEDEDEDEVPAEGPTAPATPDAPPAIPTPPTSTLPAIMTVPPAETESLQPAGLPSNAIELSNTAPIHTEAGLGDLGVSDPVMEIRVPEAQRDEPMDVEEVGQAGVVPEEKDEGLVMGEMEPPEMAVIGGDTGPAEVEG